LTEGTLEKHEEINSTSSQLAFEICTHAEYVDSFSPKPLFDRSMVPISEVTISNCCPDKNTGDSYYTGFPHPLFFVDPLFYFSIMTASISYLWPQ
jgi:hypothetical protein